MKNVLDKAGNLLFFAGAVTFGFGLLSGSCHAEGSAQPAEINRDTAACERRDLVRIITEESILSDRGDRALSLYQDALEAGTCVSLKKGTKVVFTERMRSITDDDLYWHVAVVRDGVRREYWVPWIRVDF